MSPLLKIKQTTSLLVIFKKKKKSGWVSLIEIIRVHNTIIYYNVTCIDVYKDSHSRHSRTRGDVVSGTRKTRLIRMQTYWKSQGSFPLTGGGEGGKNGARREYRNRKLLGFEKFKRRCCKKKGSLSSRVFVEIASTKRGIANFELGVKIKKKWRDIAIFWKKGTITANTADDKFPPYFHRVSRSSISNMESRDAPLSPRFSRYT